jgi:hypothetical protein
MRGITHSAKLCVSRKINFNVPQLMTKSSSSMRKLTVRLGVSR